MATFHGGPSSPTPGSPNVESPMAPDSQPSDDDDSDMQSLTNSVVDYPVEWGRSYHRYKEDSYLYPNDADERERMNLQLDCVKRVLNGKLFLSPVQNPEKVLDIGTGTGKWVVEVADMFPKAKVFGTDLSPIQPENVPPNVFFEISDCTDDEWGFKVGSFDMIHTGFMIGSLPSFSDLITNSKRYLKPGTGWLECVDLDIGPYCDDGTMPPDWPVIQWMGYLSEASQRLVPPRPLDTAKSIASWMQRAGFVDVHERIDKVPYNPWPRDPFLKELGRDWERQILLGVAGWSYKPLGDRGLGWTRERTEVFLIDVRKAMKNRYVHAYNKLHVIYGRRPSEEEERRMGQMPAPLGELERNRQTNDGR
jgi:SAM-dependent methyltransferase